MPGAAPATARYYQPLLVGLLWLDFGMRQRAVQKD
jgi:hypothetical protein